MRARILTRISVGAIRLSANGWKKARHFDVKFWLHIVTEPATGVPQLYCMQNAVAHFG